jgi:hypothetical protein
LKQIPTLTPRSTARNVSPTILAETAARATKEALVRPENLVPTEPTAWKATGDDLEALATPHQTHNHLHHRNNANAKPILDHKALEDLKVHQEVPVRMALQETKVELDNLDLKVLPVAVVPTAHQDLLAHEVLPAQRARLLVTVAPTANQAVPVLQDRLARLATLVKLPILDHLANQALLVTTAGPVNLAVKDSLALQVNLAPKDLARNVLHLVWLLAIKPL